MRAKVAIALLALASAAAAQRTFTYPDLLAQLTDLDVLWQPPRPGERCVQCSSYDRKSDAGPADHEAWIANGDSGQFARIDERAGVKEWVLADVAGPGFVARIWSADPKGELRFYVDGAAEPTWRIGFAELTSGKAAPFLEPLAGVRARGANCHVPLPFQRRLVIGCDRGDFYYHVNVRLLPQGDTVPSLSPALLEGAAAALAAARQALTEGMPWPAGAGLGVRVVEPAARERLCAQQGPGVLRGLRLALGRQPPEVYRAAIVRIAVDGHETVAVPFADFFGAAPAMQPYASWPMRVHADGTGECRFPMPFRRELTVDLERRSAAAVPISCSWLVEQRELPQDVLAFHASWHQQRDLPTRGVPDHRVLDAEGPGRFAGTSLCVRNPVRTWWGEGDERFWVDGEAFPSTFGTGTEDYFGYAWGCPDRFASAFHAQPQCDGPGTYGFTCVDRWHVLDQVPFLRGFRFDLEVWHWKRAIEVDYASVAYWYGTAGAQSGLPALPPAAECVPAVVEPWQAFVAEGALEGEALKVLGKTGGKTQTQDMAGFESGRWSKDAQLWWTEAALEDRLALELPVAQAGRHRLVAGFTRAKDYGIVQPWLAGQRLGAPIDLYAPDVASTGPLALGEADLPQGSVTLLLQITGKNERAEPAHMVGLDWVRLEPVR